MAIKLVDIEPEGDKPKKAEASKARAEKGASHDTHEPVPVDGEPALPGLTHAKPEPKARGRKKPLK